MQKAFVNLLKTAEKFDSASVSGLLRSAPDLAKHLAHVKGMFKIENDGTCQVIPAVTDRQQSFLNTERIQYVMRLSLQSTL